MTGRDVEFTVQTVSGAGGFSETEWNALGCTVRTQPNYNPFLSHAFLSALELSGCVGKGTGWQSAFLKLQSADGTTLGAAPAYVKSNSQGEYVFDHGWADAYARAGGQYYPKLQMAIPFTPATGPRLLTIPDRDDVKAALVQSAAQICANSGLSSAHATFIEPQDVPLFEAQNWLIRNDQQFHFINRDFRDYQDFLDSLASRKRKMLRKEREAARSNGITIERLTGRDLTEAIWDRFHAFYMDTGNRKWGRPYLNRNFFHRVGETMADDILLVMAKRNGQYIAGAINFIGHDRLFGRNWGCIEDHPFLHFEVCYHQAIDFALERSLKVVEAGAQGEHKLSRGYEPVTTYSAHYIVHEGLRRAIANYLVHEREEVARVGELLGEHTPFRKGARLTDSSQEEQ